MEFKELISKIETFGISEPIYWSNAIAGETGEFCNLMKKYYRDFLNNDKLRDECMFSGCENVVCGVLNNCQEIDMTIKQDMAEELADIFIYLGIIARDVLEIDLEEYILMKLKKIKDKHQVDVK
jgi:NTP pyrophosphatase (non-canonical NTP hydrolase)